MNNYTIIIPSNKPKLANETKESLLPYLSKIFDGSNYPSFSKLINDCIVSCPTEIIIIASDKVRPKYHDIDKILRLLDTGFGFVGLYYFGFFGFTKELIRQIGFFDERFIKGEFEDSDFILRLREAKIAHVLEKTVGYTGQVTKWDNERAKAHFIKKWGSIHLNECKRLMSEEEYFYDIGASTDKKFLGENFTQVQS